MMKYDTILVGATFYSAGYAAKTKEMCLVLDRRTVVGSDFAACLNSSVQKYSDIDLVSDFRKKLEDNGIISSNGGIHIVPCAMELARFYLENKIDILLETEIINIEKCENGFMLKIFNRDGLSEIFAEKIIDTEGRYIGNAKRTLAAMLVLGTDMPKIPENVGFIMKEHYDSELIFHLLLEEGDNMVVAREKMRDLIEKNCYLADWQVASVSSDFAWHYDSPSRKLLDNGILAVPSSSYGDIISAMEGGTLDASAMDRK